MSSSPGVGARHGPKPGCHEAEAFPILEAEAEALAHFSLEAEAEAKALVKKPKPGYLNSTKKIGLQSRSFGKPRSRSRKPLEITKPKQTSQKPRKPKP